MVAKFERFIHDLRSLFQQVAISDFRNEFFVREVDVSSGINAREYSPEKRRFLNEQGK
jgi:hypothetical protein